MSMPAGKFFFPSLTRISDLRTRNFEVERIARPDWAFADYVVAEVENHSGLPLELDSGRLAEVYRGDLVVGALGARHATLEATGSWEAVGEDGAMHSLTGAGLCGRLVSKSMALPPLVRLRYRGHVHVEGRRVSMSDYVDTETHGSLTRPVVLIAGTSMSAGKAVTAHVVIRFLKSRGLKVVGAKLTGVGRYRDILAMRDAGADQVFDFVDVGLPSTICPAEVFKTRLGALLARIQQVAADVVVAEAGASPMEPYNGGATLEVLGDRVACLALAAADPSATVGVQRAFGRTPDLITGVATSTDAGCQLIDKLTGIPAINVLDRQECERLEQILVRTLELAP